MWYAEDALRTKPSTAPGRPSLDPIHADLMFAKAVATRTGRSFVTGLGRTSMSAAVSRGRKMSTVWSEMPMGPPDPILGLTGESQRRVSGIDLQYSTSRHIVRWGVSTRDDFRSFALQC